MTGCSEVSLAGCGRTRPSLFYGKHMQIEVQQSCDFQTLVMYYVINVWVLIICQALYILVWRHWRSTVIRIEMAPSQFHKCFSFTLGTKYPPPTHTRRELGASVNFPMYNLICYTTRLFCYLWISNTSQELVPSRPKINVCGLMDL